MLPSQKEPKINHIGHSIKAIIMGGRSTKSPLVPRGDSRLLINQKDRLRTKASLRASIELKSKSSRRGSNPKVAKGISHRFYLEPNKQYFGARGETSMGENARKQPPNVLGLSKATLRRSLSNKLKQLATLQQRHRVEVGSLTKGVGQGERKRLLKLQQMERLQILQQAIGLSGLLEAQIVSRPI